ncbi:MAG: ribonuclease H-like domain-containing protein [Candidatus Brocadiia bacterium]
MREAGEPKTLEQWLRSAPDLAAERIPDGGWHLRWRGQAAGGSVAEALGKAVRRLTADKAADGHPDFDPLARAGPEDLLLFDLETLGLGNAAVFLIGCLTMGEGGPRLEQFLAEDYSQESSIIRGFAGRMRGRGVLVSFNGKSFDLPLLAGRAGVWRVELPGVGSLHHVDILYECRRRWGASLPDCRLQTVERCICGRLRTGDVPGAQIPEVYHEFVQTGDARLVAPILRHNAQDLVTVAEVLRRCLE